MVNVDRDRIPAHDRVHGHEGGHDHGHGHDHDHEHHHAPADFGRAFAIGIALNLGFVVAEAVFGLAANSLGLLADAGHNAGDVLGLAAAWGGVILARRRPSSRFTYGLRSSSILVALANSVALLVVTGGIAWASITRLVHPEPVAGPTIIALGTIGIVVNATTALLFMRGRKSDLNIRAAFLHMAADALVTLGVVVAGLLIIWTGVLWLDPAIGLVVSAVIIAGTWSLLKGSVSLALDAVPDGIDPRAVADYLGSLPGVTEVHDLHIWGLSTTEVALTAHLIRPAGGADDAMTQEATHELRQRFGITHATIQCETGVVPCDLAPAEVV